MLQSIQEQFKAGVNEGLDLEALREKIDLSKFEKEFAGDDPVNRYYFRGYLSISDIERTFNQNKKQNLS